ncbi:MAG: diguanylate cyclase (GGDEF)-like protein, partial [Pirellulaceae bacterium]
EETLSSTDPLTNTQNRRAFDRVAVEMIAHARQHCEHLSCLLLDIDFFKFINDTYGHSAGDIALRRTAEAIRMNLRKGDGLYRYGGDEFCVLLPGADQHVALQRAQRIRAEIAGTTITAGDQELTIRCSIGVATWREDVEEPRQLVDLADEALLLAKKSGRDQARLLDRMAASDVLAANADPFALSAISAEALMLTPLFRVKKNTLIRQVASQIVHLRVDSLPVVDEGNKLVGVIAEQDLFQQFPEGGVWDGPVEAIMQTNFVCFESDTTLEVIWDFFRRVAFSRVVIVKDSEPVGTITRSMLLTWAACSCLRETGIPIETETHEFHGHVDEAVAKIVEEMKQLAHFAANNSSAESVPAVVCSATRLMEQGDQLLALTRFADQQSPTNRFGDFLVGYCP